MPLNSAQAKKIAKLQIRDSQGHFVKKSLGIEAKASVTSPLSKETVPTNPELEKPLVQVSITNPFKKNPLLA